MAVIGTVAADPGPSSHAAAVTPSDSVSFEQVARSLYVGGTGHVTAVMAATGAVVLFSAVPAGTVLPIQITRVNATGTTATLMTALF